MQKLLTALGGRGACPLTIAAAAGAQAQHTVKIGLITAYPGSSPTPPPRWTTASRPT